MARKRQYTRPGVRHKRYAAAKLDRLTGDWRPVDLDVNELIAAASPMVRARVRQLVRDFPFFKRAVKCSCDFTIGTGIKLQSQVRNTAGELDKQINQAIEDAWNRWQEEADASGQQHFGEMQRLAFRQEAETGEFIFVKKAIKDPQRFIPYSLMAIEPDRLTDLGEPRSKSNEIHDGIEFKKDTGRPVAYWFEDDESKPVRVAAKNVIHHFDMLRAGQKRGISPYVSAILTSNDLYEYIDAELTGAKSASKWVGTLKRSLGPGFDDKGGKPTIQELENASVELLGPDDELTLLSSNRPGSNFVPFIKLLLQMIAVNCDLSYELLSGDYSGISYANLKGIRNDLTKAIRVHQKRYINHLCMPVYRDFLTYSVMAGRLSLPGYVQNPIQYQKASWIAPGLDSLDPLKEYKAYASAIDSGLISQQSVILAQGNDPDQVLNERKAYEDKAKELGVTLNYGKSSTALANNPAALRAKE